MTNQEQSPRQLMPRVTEKTIESFTRFGSLDTRGDEVVSIFKEIERENPKLFDYISERTSEILKDSITGLYIGKGFSQGVIVAYHLLRKQAEADRITE